MITINQTPVLNRVILDGNDTVVSITSSNGAGHYFRAIIFIDDVLFDTQSWSRKDAYTCEKNLKKLYNAYFEQVFSESFTAGITEQTHLKKKVSILIEERLMADDSVVQSIDLPDFFILYNAKPIAFTDTTKVAFLGYTADKYLISSTGKISVPIYSNTDAETIVVTLKDNFNTVVNTVTVASATAKKVHLYNFDLSAWTFATNTIYFTLTVTVGSTTITKVFRYLSLPDYPVKEIAFLNNFGFYQYAYIDGQFSIDNALTSDDYTQADGTDRIIEINEEFTYTLNSGSLLGSEKALLSEIANALDTKIFLNNAWIDMVSKIKKLNLFQDRKNNYSESLQFSVKPKNNIANEFYEIIENPEINFNNITSENGVDYILNFDFNFPVYNLTLEGRIGSLWRDIESVSFVSPAEVSTTASFLYVRLKSSYAGQPVYSNELENPFTSWPSSE